MPATKILSAVAIDLDRVKITFGGGSGPTADYSPLLLGVWSFIADPARAGYTPPGVLAVYADVVSGVGVTGVILLTDGELTPGDVYQVVCLEITGILNNGIDNVATFQSFPLFKPDNRDFSFRDMMPTINIREDASGQLDNFLTCMQEPADLLFHDIDKWITIFDCDLAPERFLDLILQDLGNPFVFKTPPTELEKRKLCRLLMTLYKLKGTAPGIQAGIQFFMGMKSEVTPFNGLGDLWSDAETGGVTTINGGKFSDDIGTVVSPTFVFGGGSPWHYLAKIGTPLGRLPTADEIDRALKILTVMEPVYMILENTGAGLVRGGAPPAIRNSIKSNGATVDLISELTAAEVVFLEGVSPGVQEFRGGTTQVAAGAGTAIAAGYTPPGTRYWNGVGFRSDLSVPSKVGLLSNEVTNALAVPVLVATAGTRKITLTWAAVAGATSYRIYRSVASFTSPTVADNAGEPFQISGDTLEFVDKLEAGTTRYYRITGLAAESEGFFSNVVSATAL